MGEGLRVCDLPGGMNAPTVGVLGSSQHSSCESSSGWGVDA